MTARQSEAVAPLGQILSLAPQTFVDLTPRQFVEVAGEAGYSHVGLRAIAGNPRLKPTNMSCLIDSKSEAKKVKASLLERSIEVREMESLALTPDLDLEAARAGLEIGAFFGASHLLTTIGISDFNEGVDRLSAAGLLAAEYGMQIIIEFNPWRPVSTLELACRMAQAEASGNVRVLIDTLHFRRVGGAENEIASFDSKLFSEVQLSDAAPQRPDSDDELLRQAFAERMYPGEGGLNLVGILMQLPAGMPISVEVPNRELVSRIGPVAHAKRARETTEQILHECEALRGATT